jgi:hypothetical protein
MPVNQLSDGGPDGTTLGQSRSDLVAFYGTTPVSQRSGSIQSVTYATVASSASFAAGQQGLLNSVALDVLEIKATLTAIGAWKGGA